MAALASATTPAMSRPRTLAWITTRRLPFSRLIWFGPSITRMSARLASGTKAPPGVGTWTWASAWKSARCASDRRMTTGKRRSPSKIVPASRPPSVAPTVSCTSCAVTPSRAIASRFGRMSRIGRPAVCSTLTSTAPGVLRSAAAIFCAVAFMPAKSSPKTLTATSPRTPAISSLKRIWIGWVIS